MASAARPYGGQMIQPPSEPAHDKSHTHVDLDDLMDGSERGPQPQETERADGEAGPYGAAADASGETVDGYVTGQDEGSID
jgi:hypothetical protein